MRATEFLTESDEEHRAALNQTGFWGKQGAGCLFLAKDTGRICIAHRSQAVEQPGTWGTWGGAIDSGEDPVKAVRREVKEESGYTGRLDLIPLFIFSHPSGFKYYNFLALVDKEFTPITDWETQNSDWFDYGHWPKPLHPGLVTLLSDSASTAIIQKYARAKTKEVKQQFEARPDKAAMKSIERHYSNYKDNDHGTISDYTSGEGSFDSNSQYLNKPLYKAKGAVPKEIKSWTDRTDALVARHRTPNDMTAYYGISRNPKLFSYGSNLIKNNKTTITAPFVFVNHGYTSTSLDPDIAWTFARNQLIDSSNKSVIQAHMLIIKIPKGFSGAYVGHLSAQKDRYGGRWDEMELILPRGTSFTISPKPSIIKKIVRGTTLYVFKWKAMAVPPLSLAESLDQRYPIKWNHNLDNDWRKDPDDSTEVYAEATLNDDTELAIRFQKNDGDRNEPGDWSVEFVRNDSQEVTGEGNAQRIFATVLGAIQQFVNWYKPDTVTFSASKDPKPPQLNSPAGTKVNPQSRAKLYNRMVQRYASAAGYSSQQREGHDKITYLLQRAKPGVAEGLNETTSQLGPQLYTPRPKNLDESMKPDSALWTSTASGSNNGYTSAWVEWAKSEMPQWVGHSGFLYDVSPSARILTINSDRDAMRVANKYGMNTTDIMDLFMYMPWKKIAKDYDAIHHVPSNRGADLFMHSWDVESTAWFNTKMLLNKRKVPILASKKDVAEGLQNIEIQDDKSIVTISIGGKERFVLQPATGHKLKSYGGRAYKYWTIYDIERKRDRFNPNIGMMSKNQAITYVNKIIKHEEDAAKEKPGVAEDIVETVDVLAIHAEALREHLLSNPALYENREDFQEMRGFLDSHRTPTPLVKKSYVYASVQVTPMSGYANIAYFNTEHKLLKLDKQFAYFNIEGTVKRFPETGTLSGDSLSQIYFFKSKKELDHFDMLLKLKFSNYKQTSKILDKQGVAENFADGRNPQDRGDSQRHGIPKGATMAELEKASKAQGRKGQLARWQLNMRRGKKK